MQVVTRLSVVGRALVLCVLVATFLLAPLSVAPVSADGGGSGVPGVPPDSTGLASYIDDFEEADEVLIYYLTFWGLLHWLDL